MQSIKRILIFTVVDFFLFVALAAAQTPHANRFNRAVNAVGTAFKDVGSDIRHSPEYRSFFLIDSAAQAADTASSCVGASQGFVDGNVLLGHTRSCARIALTTDR